MSDQRRSHWDGVYSAKRETEVSWFQQHPGRSLELIRRGGLSAGARVIDVGGGASRLVDALVEDGLAVTVLDVSATALDQAQARLGERAASVEWLVADVTRWRPSRPFALWHDRAVFHFLTDPADRAAYRTCLESALEPGGQVVIGTFALDGPDRCSGLPVVRYGAAELAAELGERFTLIDAATEQHLTPAGKSQSFQFCRLVRKG
jgi:2-polyprenyl-3-methyl-5-hydroxy-6-metoxy-1,4-benzoquinol methylase